MILQAMIWSAKFDDFRVCHLRTLHNDKRTQRAVNGVYATYEVSGEGSDEPGCSRGLKQQSNCLILDYEAFREAKSAHIVLTGTLLGSCVTRCKQTSPVDIARRQKQGKCAQKMQNSYNGSPVPTLSSMRTKSQHMHLRSPLEMLNMATTYLLQRSLLRKQFEMCE